jgi:hypothetical protein
MLFEVFRRKGGQLVKAFRSRKNAVYFCKVEQTLPTPDYEWEDEFEIRETSHQESHENTQMESA